MLSARTKTVGFTALLGAVLIGAPIFGALCLYPVMATNRSEVAELEQAQVMLGRWLRSITIPTETRIESERNYKAALQAEYDRVLNYYRARNALLERPLLEAYSNDPVRVKLKYEELKRQLETKARRQTSVAMSNKPFMPAYPWEQPGRTPTRPELTLIERRTCIADVIVNLMASSGYISVQQLTIGEAVAPGATAGAAQEDKGAVLYSTWPVTVEVVTAFRQVAVVLDKIVTPPPNAPCILIRSIDLSATGAGQVSIKLALDVLDFAQKEQGA